MLRGKQTRLQSGEDLLGEMGLASAYVDVGTSGEAVPPQGAPEGDALPVSDGYLDA
jgi:hypothetical protein